MPSNPFRGSLPAQELLVNLLWPRRRGKSKLSSAVVCWWLPLLLRNMFPWLILHLGTSFCQHSFRKAKVTFRKTFEAFYAYPLPHPDFFLFPFCPLFPRYFSNFCKPQRANGCKIIIGRKLM